VDELTRRDTLRLTVGCGVAAMGLVSCADTSESNRPATAAETVRSANGSTTASPSRREVAAVASVPDGGVLDVTEPAGEPAYLVRRGDAIRLVSATCTHASCRVSWQPRDRHFRCPCHGGAYDQQGMVLSGPPPRALEELPVDIADGKVYLER
jgi:Rieske Fe-S protein